MTHPLLNQSTLTRAKNIRLLVCDVDGVLTNGQLIVDIATRNYTVAFNVHDGLGFTQLQDNGIDIAIITSRTSESVTIRMERLSVKHVYQGAKDKVATLNDLRETLELSWDQIAYIGDDHVDIAVMQKVGWAITVANCAIGMQAHAHSQTEKNGGEGAVREVCDAILIAQGYRQT